MLNNSTSAAGTTSSAQARHKFRPLFLSYRSACHQAAGMLTCIYKCIPGCCSDAIQGNCWQDPAMPGVPEVVRCHACCRDGQCRYGPMHDYGWHARYGRVAPGADRSALGSEILRWRAKGVKWPFTAGNTWSAFLPCMVNVAKIDKLFQLRLFAMELRSISGGPLPPENLCLWIYIST